MELNDDTDTPQQQQQLKEQHHKTITLGYVSGQVLPLDMKLQQAYWVWAMVKNQMPQAGTEDEKYISENQVVAEFDTVSIQSC